MHAFAGRALVVSALWVLCGSNLLAQPPENESSHQKRPHITSAPKIPDDIHQAMQSRQYADVVKVIEIELANDDVQSADYLMYLQGVALTHAGQHAEARQTFEALEKRFPESDWIHRSRFGRAAVAVADRDYQLAGDIYRAEAERLLSSERKDELAQIYLEFADRYFDGIKANDPTKENTSDYKQALQYYREAAKLGPSVSTEQKVEYRVARCLEELSQYNEAARAYQAFLEKHGADKPTSGVTASIEMRSESHFRRGLCQLKNGRKSAARRTWSDFISTYQNNGNQKDGNSTDKDLTLHENLAKSKYRLAHTYGLPKTHTIGDLELATGAAEQFLKQYPQHSLAAKAELEIAQGYQHHGRNEQAIKQLRSLIANAHYAKSKHLAVARRLLGDAYRSQNEFELAIAAWKDFLESHPTDSRWPEVQTSIITAEFDAAVHSRDQGDFAAARKQWQTFLNKYPLHERAPQILHWFGDMNHVEAVKTHQERVTQAGKSGGNIELDPKSRNLFEKAIEDWNRLIAKYPKSAKASQAPLRIAITLEDHLQRREEAIQAYRKVAGSSQQAAKRRIARLTKPQLKVVTQRKYRSNETPKISLTTRNLEQVSVKIYSIDMEDYFRKMHLATGVENLDIGLIDPDHQFECSIKEYEKLKQIEQDVELPIKGPGVTAVTVSSDKIEATTMVMVSDLDVIVKSSRNELFLFAQNMVTGQPASGTNVLVSDGTEVFEELTTDAEGIVKSEAKQLRTIKDLRVFAIDNGHVASSVTQLNGLNFAIGLVPTGHLFTDRPIYRPGEIVNIKGIVRWVDQDQYTFQPGEKFTLDVLDARGRSLHTEQVALNSFGTIQSHVMLPPTVATGNGVIRLHRPSTPQDAALSFDTRFIVKEYKIEPVHMKITTDKNVYLRGESVQATIHLQYDFGSPLSNETISYHFGDEEETQTAKTDAEGNVTLTLSTQRFSETQAISLEVNCPERNVAQSHVVYLATRGFGVSVRSDRQVFIAGETFDVTTKVHDPTGKPVATKLTLDLIKVTQTGQRDGEKQVKTFEVETDLKDGTATTTLKIDQGGFYVVRATGIDQFENKVSDSTRVHISGDDDQTRLRILASKHHYHVGDTAQVTLHWREDPALALITYDGASVLGHRLVTLQRGENLIAVEMDAKLAPNFSLSANVMQGNRFHEALSGFVVKKHLNVELIPDKTEMAPTDSVKLKIKVTDANGNPISSEIAVAMVQSGLLNRFGNLHGSATEKFSGLRRQRQIRQSSSCTFRYATQTREIDQAVLEDAERRLLNLAEAEAREEIFYPNGNAENSVVGPLVFPDASSWANLSRRRIVRFSENDFDDDGRSQSAVFGGRTDPFGGGGFGGGGIFPGDTADPFGNGQIGRDFVVNGQAVNLPQFLQAQARTGFNVAFDGQVYSLPRISSQGGIGYANKRLGGQKRGRPGLSQLDQSWINGRQETVNGLTASGKMLVINRMSAEQLRRLDQNEGARLLAGGASGETGYWDPVIVTDNEGNAEIELTMPTESTSWRLTAEAVSHDAIAGTSSVDLVTRRSLFGQLRVPSAFTAGDATRIGIEVHHSLAGNRDIEVTLQAQMGEKTVRHTETVKADGPGVNRVSMPLEILESKEVNFQLTVATQGVKDFVEQTSVDVLPYGFPVYQTANEITSQDTVAVLSLPPQHASRGQSLELLIGGNVNQTLLDGVLSDNVFLPARCNHSGTLSRSISDCISGLALIEMIQRSKQPTSPHADSIRRLIGQSIATLISAQTHNGGWSLSLTRGASTDPMLTAAVMSALAKAKKAGFPVSQKQFEQGKAALKKAFQSQTDLTRQAILLSAMAQSDCGDFSLANRLYRERNRISVYGLTHLSRSLILLKHKEMASELVKLVPQDLLSKPRSRYGSGVELVALHLQTLQQLDIHPEQQKRLANWLLQHRVGSRWPVESDNGPAIAALAKHHTSVANTQRTLSIKVTVNGKNLAPIVLRPQDLGTRVSVPENLLVNGQQTIEFELEGRGEFSYSAVLSGFATVENLASTTKDWTISRRYEPEPIRLDGRMIKRGYSVISGSYRPIRNPLTQLPVGVRGQVTLSPRIRRTKSETRTTYLMLIEPLPAGCQVVENSITGDFDRYEMTPGAITFYIGGRQRTGDIRYQISGYTEGTYKVAPTVLRSYYAPDKIAVAKTSLLEVIAAGKKSTDSYTLTPDELFGLGNGHFAKQNYLKAHQYIEKLFADERLDKEPFKQCATILFKTSLNLKRHSDTVKYFEVIKERYPTVELSFEEILLVASAYREIQEHERSYLVHRATVQGSFERENQVAGFLNARGHFLRSIETMESLLRSYPAESYVATANYALAQEVYRRGGLVREDETLQKAGITRTDLVSGSIEMLDHFLTQWPEDPSDDEAAFALATGLIDLQQFERAISRSERYATTYSHSKLLDSFWYIAGFCHFELQNPKEALQVCEKVANAEFEDSSTGSTRQADNKWEAIYIMGQIYHSLGDAPEAIEQYTKVQERFVDAAEAIEFFSHQSIKIPDVTTLSPQDAPTVTLEHRNLAQADIKVYRIDLMKFGLTQQNLDQITAINLAGIKPYYQKTIELGDGKDYQTRETQLDLPLKEQGAFFVVCRGESQYSSGLVVVTPLALSVQEDEVSGRVRVSVKNKQDDAFIHDVHVKVIGSSNDKFVSGETDLRGLFIADAIKGTSTVIAVNKQQQQYAFHRGNVSLLSPPVSIRSNEEAQMRSSVQQRGKRKGSMPNSNAPLLDNLFRQNGIFQNEKKQLYDGLLNNQREGFQSKEAY